MASEHEFVDQMGLFFELMGGPRTMGRIYGWLMICEPRHQSLTELATALGVSKPAVSTVVRHMQEGGLVQRLPASSREHHYRLTPGGFTRMLEAQLDRMQAGADAATTGLAAIGKDRPEERELLEEFRDFCEFAQQDVRGEFMQRWLRYRDDRRPRE